MSSSTPMLVDILNHYNWSRPGGNPHRFIELFGGEMVECLWYEPDPNTSRSEFYYNTRLNKIFRKKHLGSGVYIWKNITQIN